MCYCNVGVWIPSETAPLCLKGVMLSTCCVTSRLTIPFLIDTSLRVGDFSARHVEHVFDMSCHLSFETFRRHVIRQHCQLSPSAHSSSLFSSSPLSLNPTFLFSGPIPCLQDDTPLSSISFPLPFSIHSSIRQLYPSILHHSPTKQRQKTLQ